MKLPDEWTSYLLDKPETGMGYQIATIELKDGSKFEQVVIVNGSCISNIRGNSTIPFVESDIVSIEITHDKWR